MKADDIKTGTGTELARGQHAMLHYQVARKPDELGTSEVIESSLDDRPLTVIVGGGDLADDIEEALIGMRVGGTRRVAGDNAVFEFYLVEASSPAVDRLTEWKRCATPAEG